MKTRPNKDKKLIISVGKSSFARYPIRTHLISHKDNIVNVVKKHTKDSKKDDILVISERVVAISQGRSYLLEDIHPGWWAKTLSQFVYNHPGGIGLRNPYTMQLALDEAGLLRILFAAGVSVITKPFGMKGMFYKVVGNDINAIDGPAEYTLPPGNMSAKLGPKNPNKVAQKISQETGRRVVIIDANDYGVNILGKSEGVQEDLIRKIFKDNPMGQTNEQTPIIIVREQ